MKGTLFSTPRHITAAAIATLLALAVGLIGCAGGPKPLDVVIPGGIADTAEVRVIEYLGSDAGEPLPFWLGPPTGELESLPVFSDSFVFRFTLGGATLEEVQASMRSFPESRSLAAAIIDRALAKADGVTGVPDDLMDRAVRIVAAIEYAGTSRAGEFWVHEELVAEEAVTARYRGWLLYSVPRDQVHAGLVLAYDNAASSFPPATEPELQACEAMQARFSDGL